MCSMIGKCLEMAGKHGVQTIAFPTVGCGALHYAPDDVIDCFIKARQRTDAKVKVIYDFMNSFRRSLLYGSP